MAAESIAENYTSNKIKDVTESNTLDKEVKRLLQRQDWLENMKQVFYYLYYCLYSVSVLVKPTVYEGSNEYYY